MNSARIGSRLDWRDLADPRRLNFVNLTREQQGDAVRRMAGEGHHETTIAQASGLSVEVVRRTLAE